MALAGDNKNPESFFEGTLKSFLNVTNVESKLTSKGKIRSLLLLRHKKYNWLLVVEKFINVNNTTWSTLHSQTLHSCKHVLCYYSALSPQLIKCSESEMISSTKEVFFDIFQVPSQYASCWTHLSQQNNMCSLSQIWTEIKTFVNLGSRVLYFLWSRQKSSEEKWAASCKGKMRVSVLKRQRWKAWLAGFINNE